MQQHREQRQHHTNLSSSTHFTNLTVDDLEITQRIEFHRGLATLENILCNVCEQKFTSINVDTAGVCIHCCNDNEVPGLYSLENNMDPGRVPPKLCVSL